MLGRFGAVGNVDLVAEHLDLGVLHHTAQEEHYGEEQTDFNGDGEVEYHSEQECDDKHGDIRFRILENAEHSAPAAHVVSHHHEHSGKARHGHIVD